MILLTCIMVPLPYKASPNFCSVSGATSIKFVQKWSRINVFDADLHSVMEMHILSMTV